MSTIVGACMLAVAGVIDAAQFLLNLTVFLALASMVLTFIAAALFGLWFLLLGVSYMGGKKAGLKLAAVGGGIVIEFIPLINALPGTMAAVLTVILLSRIEDRETRPKSVEPARKPVRIGGPTRIARDSAAIGQAA